MYIVWLCKTPSHTQADRASPIHDASEEGAKSWLTSDDKWTVGVMTMQDDHREAMATWTAISYPFRPCFRVPSTFQREKIKTSENKPFVKGSGFTHMAE